MNSFSPRDYYSAIDRVRHLRENPLTFPAALTDQMDAAAKDNHRIASLASIVMGGGGVKEAFSNEEKIAGIMLGFYEVMDKCQHVLMSPRPLVMFVPFGVMYCADCTPTPTAESEAELNEDNTCDMCGVETSWLRPVLLIHGFVTLHMFLCVGCDTWLSSDALDIPDHFPKDN